MNKREKVMYYELLRMKDDAKELLDNCQKFADMIPNVERKLKEISRKIKVLEY